MSRAAVMWFRGDLRLHDNEALHAALTEAETVACVGLRERPGEPPHGDARVTPGDGAPAAPPASRRWRLNSLAALDASLRARGGALAVTDGPPAVAIARLAAELGARVVTCSRDYSPAGLAEEDTVRSALAAAGVTLVTCPGQLETPPGTLVTASDRPYRVFTPFFRAWSRALQPRTPLPAPERVPAPDAFARRGSLLEPPALGLEPPTEDGAAWAPGEDAGLRRLDRFVGHGLARYDERRDLPGVDGTSELSVRLAHGELSPRQVIAATHDADLEPEVAAPFLRQLAWREFAYHVLAAFPALAEEPWKPAFSAMPWREDPAALAAWASGTTGFPMVDAGMRQLATSGWMHNRVRLLTASFLTKDLLLPWLQGERVFAELLADYDPALNAFNWQWVAGSGADASPYFRVFNPVTQGEKFDRDGAYVRRWVPELDRLSPRWIHHPWDATEPELRRSQVRVGDSYPQRLVEHSEARLRALAAFQQVRRSGR